MVLYVLKEKEMLTLRVFVGISQIGEGKASYALTFQNAEDAKSITVAPVIVSKTDSREFDTDFVIMTALKAAIDITIASKKPSEKILVNAYSGSDLISYMLEEEYRKEGSFIPEKAKNGDIWNYLIQKSDEHNIDFHIYGESSMFSGISKTGKARRS